MKSIFKLIIVIGLPLMILSGCYKDNFTELHPVVVTTAVCDTNKTMSFSNDIMPIINNNCGTANSCHGTSNTSRIDLTDYNGVNAIAVDGRLTGSVVWDGNSSPMPKGSGQISVCDQTKIKKWVADGAPNN
jgi:hypothetical protein